MSFDKKLSEILASSGLLNSVLISKGGKFSTIITPLNPEVLPRINKTLRVAKLATRPIGAAMVEVFEAGSGDVIASEAEALVVARKMVKKWQAMLEGSTDYGYRKASKGLRARVDQLLKTHTPIQATASLAKTTKKLAKQSSSVTLQVLAQALEKTARSGDQIAARKLLARLAGDKIPLNKPTLSRLPVAKKKIDELKEDTQQSMKAPQHLTISAKEYLEDYRVDHPELTDADLSQWENKLNSVFDGWYTPDQEYVESVQAWKQAIQELREEWFGLSRPDLDETPDFSVPESSEDMSWAEDIFSGEDSVSKKASKTDENSEQGPILDLVEGCIEEYAADKHPKKITKHDVLKYLKTLGKSSDDAELIHKMVQRITARRKVRAEKPVPVKAPPKPQTPPKTDPFRPRFPKEHPQPAPRAEGEKPTPVKSPPKPQTPPKTDPFRPRFPKEHPQPAPRATVTPLLNEERLTVHDVYGDRPPKFSYFRQAKRGKRLAAYDDEVHPDTANWYNGQHPVYGQHPGMREYGDQLSRASWEYTQRLNQQRGASSLLPQTLVHKILQIEAQHKRQLEQLAVSIVSEAWGISPSLLSGELIVSFDQMNRIDPNDTVTRLAPQGEANFNQLPKDMKDEVFKRINLNQLSQGAGVHEMLHIGHMAQDALKTVNPELVALYQKLSSVAHSYYWMLGSEAVGGLGQSGSVKLEMEYPESKKERNMEEWWEDDEAEDATDYDTEQETVDSDSPVMKVVAKAMTFPVLVQELSKGVTQLISMHHVGSLPKDQAQKVMFWADAAEQEIPDIQVGPEFWRRLLRLAPEGVDYTKLYYALTQASPGTVQRIFSLVASRSPEAQRELSRLLAPLAEETPENDDLLDYEQNEESDEDQDWWK